MLHLIRARPWKWIGDNLTVVIFFTGIHWRLTLESHNNRQAAAVSFKEIHKPMKEKSRYRKEVYRRRDVQVHKRCNPIMNNNQETKKPLNQIRHDHKEENKLMVI